MKKLIAFVLAALMLAAMLVPVSAEGTLELTADSHLTLGETYVDGIDGTITVGKLKANFASAVDVAGKADDAAVATDDAVSAGGESLRALIYGDVNRDGKITVTEVTAMHKMHANWDVNVNTHAADVDASGKVNVSDVTKMLKYLAGWDDISLGNVRMVYNGAKKTAANEDKTLDFFFATSMDKIGETTFVSTGEYSRKIKLARNEHESCQVFFVSETDREGLSLDLSDFEYEYGGATLGCEINPYLLYDCGVYNLDWVTAKTANNRVQIDDKFPEVLLKMTDTFEMKAGKAVGFMITVKADSDAPAGMYKATLNVKDGENVIKTADVYAYVWNFTLPEQPYSATSFCIGRYDVGKYGESYKEYYDFLLNEYKISAYTLPYDITDDACDEYLDNPRVTSYVIAGNGYDGQMSHDDDYKRAAYAKLQTKPEWADRGFFYCVDEPWHEYHLVMREEWEKVRDVLDTTDFKYIAVLNKITYPMTLEKKLANEKDYWELNGIDCLDYYSDFVNLWCPQSDAFEPFSSTSLFVERPIFMKKGEFRPRYEAFRERGDTMWWYVCISPGFPYANFFTYHQGAMTRALLWQQYMVNSDGMLYYSTTGSWSTISRNRFEIKDCGDGVLMYCGKTFGTPGPLASWRLVQIRDGLDDFDYLHMAEEIYGRDEVMKTVAKVTLGMRDYTGNYKDVEAARDALAKMIEDAD